MRPRLHDKIPAKLLARLTMLMRGCSDCSIGEEELAIELGAVSAALSRSYRRGYIAGHLAARRPHKRPARPNATVEA